MDKINKDNLYTTIGYVIVLFIIGIILYNMYKDSKKEPMENIIDQKRTLLLKKKQDRLLEKFVDSNIQPPVYKNIDNIEHFQNSEIYIKKNHGTNSIKDAKCNNLDILNNGTCFLTPKSYLKDNDQEIFIQVLSDNVYDYGNQKVDSSMKNYFFGNIEGIDINEYRKTHFNFVDSSGIPVRRKLDPTNPTFEKKIINYFKTIVSLNNDFPTAPYDPYDPNNPSFIIHEFDDEPDKTVLALLSRLLTLDSSDNENNEPAYLFKSYYNINNIKNKVKQAYLDFISNKTVISEKNKLINIPPENYNCTIQDYTKLVLHIDSNNEIYCIELRIKLEIKLHGLAPTFQSNINQYRGDKSSIEILDYLDELIYAPNMSFRYTVLPFNNNLSIIDENDKIPTQCIYYPIFIKIPRPDNYDLRERDFLEKIKAYVSLLLNNREFLGRGVIKHDPNLNIVDRIVDQFRIAISTRENFNNIDSFFAFFNNTNFFTYPIDITDSNSTTYLLSSNLTLLLRKNIDPNDNEYHYISLTNIGNTYQPYLCDSSYSFYRNKCLPSCPEDYPQDFGLICLKNNINNYIPDSKFCKFFRDVTGIQGGFETFGNQDLNNKDKIIEGSWKIDKDPIYDAEKISRIEDVYGSQIAGLIEACNFNNLYVSNSVDNTVEVLLDKKEDTGTKIIIDDKSLFTGKKSEENSNESFTNIDHNKYLNFNKNKKVERFLPFLS